MADENEILISLIKARRPIYDSTHRHHSNRLVVDGLWMEIAKEMNKSAVEVKRKWTKLRNAYVREMRVEKLSSGDIGKKKRKPWYLSDSLAFLQGSIRHRKLMGQWNITDELPPKAINIPGYLSNFSFPVEDSSTNCLVKVEDQDFSFDGYEDISSVKEKTTYNLERKKTRKENDENSSAVKSKNYANELGSDLLFFKSLLPDISKLSNSNKRKLKLSLMGSLNELLEAQEKETGCSNHKIAFGRQNEIESSLTLTTSPSSQIGMSLSNTGEEICSHSTSVTSSQCQF